MDKKFDLIISIAVLEHIPKDLMDNAMENMARYLNDGGIMYHEVDLKDHVNPLNPFGFYKYAEEKWMNLTTGTIFHTNRLRPQDFLDLLKKYNMQLLYCKKEKPGNLPPKINDYFKDTYTDEDLRIGEVVLIAQKGTGN